MPRLPIPGTDDDRWGDILNDFLLTGHRSDGTTRGVLEVSNVKDFGAQGDGTADDTQAIQVAINTTRTAGGGVVWFPRGTYRTTATLTIESSNIVLRGAGNASMIKSSVPVSSVIRIGHANDLNQCTNNQIIDLTIDRSVKPDLDSSGISVERARYIRVTRVNVHNQGQGFAIGVRGEVGIPTQFVYLDQVLVTGGNFPDSCIHFYAGADFAISRSFVEPSNRGIVMAEDSNGILIVQTTVINGNAFNYGIVSEGTGFARYMIGVNVENALHQQIRIAGVPGNKREVVADSWIGAGDAEGTTRGGILIEPGIENVTIANNRIGDQRTFGIKSHGSYVRIVHNVIESNGSACPREYDGIILGGGYNVLVQGNTVYGSTQRYGILAAGDLDYYLIADNILHRNGIGGLRVDASGQHKIVHSNLE